MWDVVELDLRVRSGKGFQSIVLILGLGLGSRLGSGLGLGLGLGSGLGLGLGSGLGSGLGYGLGLRSGYMEIGLGSGFDVVHALKIVKWKKEVRGQKWKQVAWWNRVITWYLGIMVDHSCDVCFGMVSCSREWMNACVWNFVMMV